MKRLQDLKKRKRDDPVAIRTLRIWDLSFLRDENENELSASGRLAENMIDIDLNLQGVRFTLSVAVSLSDDFNAMRKSEFYAFQNRTRSFSGVSSSPRRRTRERRKRQEEKKVV